MDTPARRVARRVAVVVKGWPRLSETFIAQEVLGLERLGLAQLVVSLRHPTDRAVHELNRRVAAPVLYLPERLRDDPGRVARALAKARRMPGWPAARAALAADLARAPAPAAAADRLRRFAQGCVLAAELPADVGWLHAHFLHTPASVARTAALLTGLPWSFSAHAVDIWTSPDWEIRRKLREARWGVTCTAMGHARLAALAPDPARVGLVYHGLDFARFPAPVLDRPPRDGRDPRDPVVLLTVGRAVEKKGLDVMLEALARLPADLHWRWVHVGGGQLDVLQERAGRLGVAERVTWHGAQPQDAVIAHYQTADLFVLPSRPARNGDRDGLPNVLMEAQALGLACLSTALPSIAELIEDGATGVLVPPGDAAALAGALEALVRDPARRAALAAAGCARVRRDFGCEAGIRALHDRLRSPL
ncbi:glycosyltransferase [Azospirillum sp.]|uniref:glycosyltransferase n=1 Tax=Azospirillum sp. TaxID=34012 RepID=UPI002D52FB28|nr:glycosyltransferase [Azospirillum sp.]HYD69037.1 glycosyltransferase [Azospirillum sp.]